MNQPAEPLSGSRSPALAVVDRPDHGQGGPLHDLDGLAPRILGARASGAADRRLPDDLARALAAADLFKIMTPRALGGLELDPLAAAEVVEAASRIDGSVGWCVMIGAQNSWYASFLPRPVASHIIGPPRATVAGVLRPGGKAAPANGYYRVSGRWSLASGCTYADHLMAACFVERTDADGHGPELRLVFVPATSATILDSWHSVGLRATGSHDFVLPDVVVPDEWTLPYPNLGAAPHDGPLYRDGYQNLAFVLQAAQALGVARAALDSFTELAATTVRWTSGASLRDRPVVQAQVAKVEAGIRSAKAWLGETVGVAWDRILAGSPPTRDQRVLIRLAITHAITSAAEAAEILQRLAGAATVGEDHPLQRQFQDLRTAVAHIQAAPNILELTGALLLGSQAPPSALL